MPENQITSESIEVCLATFNGERNLDEQLESILKYLGSGRIIAHDDGSIDKTPELLHMASDRDKRVKIIDLPPTGSAKANFSLIMEQSTAEYILCSDQDDIWIPEKIEILKNWLKFYEGVYGSSTPLLIHSDLRLIDDKGEEIASSFWKYQNIDPKWGDQFNLLITQNVVTGCAMIANRALLDKALPVPHHAVMHDSWLALVACAFGKLVWINEPTVLYRQHDRNEVGAKKFGWQLFFKNFKAGPLSLRESQKYTAAQAAAFAERFPNSPQAAQAQLFAQLPNMTPWRRRRTILQQRFFKIGIVRNLAWLWLI